MNTATPIPPTFHNRGHVTQDLDDLPQPEDIVELATVPGFLRRSGHRFHLDEINRFGSQVGRSAEAMHLAYITQVDSTLGLVRVFPVPFLERVYKIVAKQFGWPEIAPALPVEEAMAIETVKGHRRVVSHLTAMLEVSDDAEVRRAIGVVLREADARLAQQQTAAATVRG